MVNFYIYYNIYIYIYIQTHTYIHTYIYIYIYKIAVNPKRYTGIDRYPKYIVPVAKPVRPPVRYWHPWWFVLSWITHRGIGFLRFFLFSWPSHDSCLHMRIVVVLCIDYLIFEPDLSKKINWCSYLMIMSNHRNVNTINWIFIWASEFIVGWTFYWHEEKLKVETP